jgi:hypothetical protein
MTVGAPFPWFGGKSRAAPEVWAALGDVTNYVEPFGGSAALLLARPGGPGKVETYNDADGLLVNWWRAVKSDPDAVAGYADWPVSEADMHARHWWLVSNRDRIRESVLADPEWSDAKAAGWWVWGACAWIGSGWCDGRGPWRVAGGRLTKGNAGRGINRQIPHLGDAGRGINRQIPHLGDAGQGILKWFGLLSERLRRVRITCGDWRRVCTRSVVERHGLSGVVFDPPYPEGWSTSAAYAGQDTEAADICRDVFSEADCLSHRGVRVVVCGYEGTWTPPEGWTTRRWTARKGYADSQQHHREVLWCSPSCVPESAPGLFGDAP